MRAAVAGLLLVGAAALGCAQPGTPPGGEPDRSPPRVVEVVPAAFDTLTDPRARVVIRFNERISERLEGVRDWEEAVLVSPATSPHRVDAGRRGIRISLVDGWEPDRVYRVVVRPVFRDLFENMREEPIDLVFSTGAAIPHAALAGFVTDRIEGSPVEGARVEAVGRTDTTPYLALSDTAGFFALPFMSAGAYRLRAWVDQDRDLDRDFSETQDSLDVVFGPTDTAVVALALLRPDTTPARLVRAEPVDSATVRLHFDDYFELGAVDGEARLYTVPDSALLGPAPLSHPARFDSLRAAEASAAAADTVQEPPISDADTVRVDTPLADAAPAEAIGVRRDTDRSSPLPSQVLVLHAPDLLQPDSTYYVRVQGLTNIQGVGGGGGTAEFLMPSRPEPEDTIPPDTVPPDTVPPDTAPAHAPFRRPGGGREGRDR